MKHMLVVLFLILTASINVSAQEGEHESPGPIEKIETPNGSAATRIPVIHGYLMDSDEATVKILVNDGSGVGLEIGLQDIEVVYKWYNKDETNHHKTGLASGVALGTAVTIYKVRREDGLNDFGVPISVVIGWGLGYWMSAISNSEEEIPFKLLFYDAAKNSMDKLVRGLKDLETNSELEFVLKQ